MLSLWSLPFIYIFPPIVWLGLPLAAVPAAYPRAVQLHKALSAGSLYKAFLHASKRQNFIIIQVPLL